MSFRLILGGLVEVRDLHTRGCADDAALVKLAGDLSRSLDDPFLNAEEAGALVNRSARWIKNKVREGLIPALCLDAEKPEPLILKSDLVGCLSSYPRSE